MTIHYMLPDFLLGRDIYTFLKIAKEEYPEKFYENQDIDFIYGCFPYCIWNGGSFIGGRRFYEKADIEEIIHYYNDILNLPIAFTFTNPLLEKNHCYDTYANLIAELAHNGKNYILVSSPILEEYLRTKYPNYYYCKSVIGNIENIDLTKNYKYSVLPRKFNKDLNILTNIPLEMRHKVEIIATDTCDINCPYWDSEHYQLYAKAQLNFDGNPEKIKCLLENKWTADHIISKQEIDNFYISLGYTHFKISGRGDPAAIIYRMIDYFVKPEYKYEILQLLLNSSILEGKK